MNVFDVLARYFSYDFVWYAVVVGVFIAVASSLFGVVLVLKRMSFIGDGLSHVAFGALAVAAVVGLTDNMLIVLPVTLAAAVLLLLGGRRAKVKGDAAIAMLSVGSLALGYILMSVFSSSGNVSGDVCASLFGSYSIITLTLSEVVLCIALSALVIGLFVLFYNKIFSVTFDESFACAQGLNTTLYNLLIAVLTACIIVLAMNLVGSLLISALLIFPALSAMQIARSFRGTVIFAAVTSCICAVEGILAAILLSTPVGPTIVIADLIAFGVCFAVGKILRR